MPAFRSLADYGVIGDARTAALVTGDGRIDWWCVPRFDSPSVFARILDRRRGGHFAVSPHPRAAVHMKYEPGTNVLLHRYVTSSGEAHLHDALVWPTPGGSPGSILVRCVEGVKGRMRLRVRFEPRPEYGDAEPVIALGNGGADAVWVGGALALRTPAPLRAERGAVVGDVQVAAGERLPFVVTHIPSPGASPVAADEAEKLLESTREAWRDWSGRTLYVGPHREIVERSALALRLLMYDPTGAVVAAPTTSLPEAIGGVRNWDYRYSWVRDGAFVVDALFRIGHPRYAQRFLAWLLEVARKASSDLRIMYDVTGSADLPERTLPRLEGYRRCAPVRVGNAAATQRQLDIFGELFIAVHEWYELGQDVSMSLRRSLGEIADAVAREWREPDHGFWEMRAAPRHYVLSKAMAWAALDRALLLDLPGDREAWARGRDELKRVTLEEGWSAELGAFQMAFGHPHLDAANLLLPLVGIVSARDPRMVATVERTMEALTVDGLVYRYLDAEDGVPGTEAAFTYCTFWLVDNLALQGRLDEARAIFDRTIARATPLGLFAEEVDPRSGEHLGNFPQGLPHIGVIRSALLLGDVERARRAAGGDVSAPSK